MFILVHENCLWHRQQRWMATPSFMPQLRDEEFKVLYRFMIAIACKLVGPFSCMYVFSSGLYTSFPTNGLTSPRAVLAQTIPPCKQKSTSLSMIAIACKLVGPFSSLLPTQRSRQYFSTIIYSVATHRGNQKY